MISILHLDSSIGDPNRHVASPISRPTDHRRLWNVFRLAGLRQLFLLVNQTHALIPTYIFYVHMCCLIANRAGIISFHLT
jgi:hypothetical protein